MSQTDDTLRGSIAPLTVHNGQAFDLARCPVVSIDEFRRIVIEGVTGGQRIASLFGRPAEDAVRLTCILADDPAGTLRILAADVADNYPALTCDCPQAHWFEREIFEQCGIRPAGHPWLKPIRFTGASFSPTTAGRGVTEPPTTEGRGVTEPLFSPTTAGRGVAPGPTVGVTDFFRMAGDEVHEVAVGPVHAGVIEPGHFRFQCLGETVYHLEISLGYQHRGVEQALQSGNALRIPHYIETLAGDTTIGHATAYYRAIESLTGLRPSPRAQAIRGIAAELERLANHIGDLGALAGDVGFLPTMNYCGRIRGDVLNLTATLCGNRFGRGLLVPGGVRYDIEPARAQRMASSLAAIESDARDAIELMFDTPSMLARLDGTGTVAAEVADQIGLVGPAARACGLARDARIQHSYGIYRFASLPMSTWHSGDCFARAYVRWLEVQQSFNFVRELLGSLPAGDLEPDGPSSLVGQVSNLSLVGQVSNLSLVGQVSNLSPTVAGWKPALPSNKMAVTLVEGWRGEICHAVATDEAGRIAHYKIVDPSLHNWFGLAMALRDQPISDFPLCNKSFNLSYCGHDL